MKRMTPPPPEFETVYIKGGWRAIERVFGPRPDVITRWLNFLGRDRLDAKRQDWMRDHGKERMD